MSTGLNLQDRRVWIAGAVAIALIITAAAWFLVIGSTRSDTANVRSQTADAQTQNTVLEGKNATLVRQSRHLGSYQAALTKALAVLPAHNELATFSRSVTEYAQQTGVSLTSISVGAPAPVVAAAPTLAPSSGSETASDSTTSTDSTDSTVPTAAPTTASGPLSTTFTLQASGTMAQDLAFLNAVRTGPRAALIISTQFASATGQTTLTAQVNVFSSPMPAGQLDQLRRLLKPAK